MRILGKNHLPSSASFCFKRTLSPIVFTRRIRAVSLTEQIQLYPTPDFMLGHAQAQRLKWSAAGSAEQSHVFYREFKTVIESTRSFSTFRYHHEQVIREKNPVPSPDRVLLPIPGSDFSHFARNSEMSF